MSSAVLPFSVVATLLLLLRGAAQAGACAPTCPWMPFPCSEIDPDDYFFFPWSTGRAHVLEPPADENGNDENGVRFGYSVATSSDGRLVAVGAPHHDGFGVVASENHGAVHVFGYQKNGQQWALLQTIVGESAGDEFGSAVRLSADGSVLAAATSGVSTSRQGYVRVFRRRGSDSGELFEEASVLPAARANGLTLSQDGTTIAYYPAGEQPKQAQVVRYDSASGRWGRLGNVTQPLENVTQEVYGLGSPLPMDLSADGRTFALAGSRAIGSKGGLVQVLSFDGSAWEPKGAALPAAARPSAVALSADGGTVAVGESESDEVEEGAGLVRVYSFAAGGRWKQLGQELGGAGEEGGFGWSVDLSPDGRTVAAGAPKPCLFSKFTWCGTTTEADGYGRVLRYDKSRDAWVPVKTLLPDAPRTNNGVPDEAAAGYSFAVSADGSAFAMGVPGIDLAANSVGSGANRVVVYRQCRPFSDDHGADGEPTAGTNTLPPQSQAPARPASEAKRRHPVAAGIALAAILWIVFIFIF